MNSQLLYYRSKFDDGLQPLPVCETGEGRDPKALLLDVSPGAISNLPVSAQRCAELAGWAREAGEACVVAKPCGRGPGSVYQGPGEVDLFEALDFLCRTFPIDRARVSLMGASMGGAATWYLASHYPDQFAAAAPFCGYCDYRLWTKPGGTIMRMQPWESFSWQSRDAAFRPENLSHTGLWITHGEWDTSIGGGVPVEHSRRMSHTLQKLQIPHTYVEVPACGHGCMIESTTRLVVAWLCRQRRVSNPDRVRLVVHGLRHPRSHWVSVDQLERYGRAAQVDAAFEREGRLVVRTDNVRQITLGPSKGRNASRVVLDGKAFPATNLSRHAMTFVQERGRWKGTACLLKAGREKRHGVSGPVGDVFFEPLRIVKGTKGSPRETFFIQWLAGHLPGFFKQKNGGVHRGVFDGESFHEMRVVEDEALSHQEIETCNLILLGNYRSNVALAAFEGKLPLEFGDRELRLGGNTYHGRRLGLCACFPSPAAPDRMIVVIGGASPEAVTYASHLNLQLLPDYLVWDGDRTLDFGFFDNDWRIP